MSANPALQILGLVVALAAYSAVMLAIGAWLGEKVDRWVGYDGQARMVAKGKRGK